MGPGVATSRAALMDRLVNKHGAHRSEATIQSDVRMLLLDPELGLEAADLRVELETQVGAQQRIDVEVGNTVIEVKRTLAAPAAVAAATKQLARYVQIRAAETGQRYVGVITDGQRWIAFHEVDGELREATRHDAASGANGAQPLLRWLEGVLATKKAVKPTPAEIAERLGATSSSHALDRATLDALYLDSADLPTVKLKRELWANLLRSALGTQFTDSDDLFLEHTLLVNSAEIIAHLVLGVDVEQLSPATLLSGDQFVQAGLYGVVDRDFFDWVLEVPGGDGYIAALARRLARFDWSAVEHDVLKVLYESVIAAETRKALGEYYTPDWLANRIVSEAITDPLNQRTLDPSCGSGTFVFYAVKRYFAAAEEAKVPLREAMAAVTSRVIGIDLHPVAVALARVTYLLALGRDRLNAPDRGSLSVPVYLGDSLGWDQHEDLLSVDQLVIPTDVGDQLMSAELRFPNHLLADSAVFDDLVEALVSEAGRAAGKNTGSLSDGTVRRLAIAAADLPGLNANFVRLRQLHEADRDHIWSYYIRNVSRPAWLSRDENRVDVLIGNPPWLSYRHMTTSMQTRFKQLSVERGFWHNETTATHQDLAGLFVARAVERYLKTGGRLAFVVPNSVIDRDYWTGFRAGKFDGANVTFTTSWDLRRIRPHLFPRGSAVIFATRSVTAKAMTATALVWAGRAPHRHAASDDAMALTQTLGQLTVSGADEARSPYAKRFTQGANLVPRLFFRVQKSATTALGAPSGRTAIRSQRAVSEKAPWKTAPSLTGTVENQFIAPTVLGEQVLPYRMLPSAQFVVPLTSKGDVLDDDSDGIDAYPGLADWMRQASAIWRERGTSKLTLAGQIDHMRKLTGQRPAARVRVVYAASGMHATAAVLMDERAVVEHAVYWAAVTTETEGHYLTGILNSPVLTELLRPLMSYGKDERHIDKHVWKLPIPLFDLNNERHTEIAAVSRELATDISERTLRSSNFVTNRQDIRKTFSTDARAQRLNGLVAELLDVEPGAVTVLAQQDAEAGLIRTTTGAMVDLDPAVQIDVDCEYDHDGRVYLWSVRVTDTVSGDVTVHSFGDSSESFDEHELAQTVAQHLGDLLIEADAAGKAAHWYYYGHAEARQLRRILGHGADAVLSRGIDVLTDVIRPNFFSPAGYGLKHLAGAAGAQWQVLGATGADTYAWIAQARAGDADAWLKLQAYNQDDTHALALLRRHLMSL